MASKIDHIIITKNKNGRIKFLGHCYVKKEDFTIKEERDAFKEDIKKVRIIYRNKKYKLI